MADSTITINRSTEAGGEVLDETSVTQGDGTTAAKRARADIGFGADDARGRLVARSTPLPVADELVIQLLTRMAEDIHAVRELLELLA